MPVVFSSGFNATELMDQLPQKTQASFSKNPTEQMTFTRL